MSNSLTHRGWTIRYTCMPRYSAGSEVEWSRWVATKGDLELRGRENQASACPAYGDAIRAIDEIEVPDFVRLMKGLPPLPEPYEGVL